LFLASAVRAEKAAKVADAAKAFDADAAEVSTEEIKSYYWWEGKVNFDPEWRVAVGTSKPFADVRAAIEAAHSYDTPMIIYDLPAGETMEGKYWKGIVACGDEEKATDLAKKLVEARVVACAQATPAGTLAIKTTGGCKQRVVEACAGSSVDWAEIGGNESYLKWLDEECAAAG